MKILLLGNGGREHALAWKIAQSPKTDKLFIAPGNAGTRDSGENVRLDINNFEEVGDFVKSNGIDMVVVGPEAPLVKGIVDYFRSADEDLNKVPVIGPSKAYAMMEGSKIHRKIQRSMGEVFARRHVGRRCGKSGCGGIPERYRMLGVCSHRRQKL